MQTAKSEFDTSLMKSLVLSLVIYLVAANTHYEKDFVCAPHVDLSKIAEVGNYYVIADKPVIIEQFCYCSRVHYSWNEELNELGVIESCRLFGSQGRNITSISEVHPTDDSGAHLEETSLWLLKSPYDFLQVADDYSWLVIGSSQTFFWILSAHPLMEQTILRDIIKTQEQVNGYNLKDLNFVDHQQCTD